MRQLSLSIAYVVFLTYRQEQEVVGLFHYVSLCCVQRLRKNMPSLHVSTIVLPVLDRIACIV